MSDDDGDGIYTLSWVLNQNAWIQYNFYNGNTFQTKENIFLGVAFVTITAAVICFPTISLWALFGSVLRKFIKDTKIKKIIECLLAILLVLTGIFILIR